MPPDVPRYVALLRAVNVGGRQVGMAELRGLLERQGYGPVTTWLQSGNVVLGSKTLGASALEAALERQVSAALGMPIEFFVRSAADWTAVLAENPFPREAATDPSHLVVAFLKAPPPPEAWAALRAAIPGRERLEGRGREAYLVYPDGIGRSKLTPALIERKLGTRSTSRNWNTVTKLDAMASGALG